MTLQPSPWITTDDGLRLLRRRAQTAADWFATPALLTSLAEGLAALRLPGSRDFRVQRLLWTFSAELPVLCLASKSCISVPPAAWVQANAFLALLDDIDGVVFQGRTNTPAWRSDLITSEIGLNLALALHLHAAPAPLDTARLESFVRHRCLEPILADWLDHSTRIHSLDTMGHNWWSVMVGSAGIIAVTLDDGPLASRVAAELLSFFHYQGNDLGRKRRNFGEHGDFVESFHYADYALFHPVAFAKIFPAFRLVPDALGEHQLRGLADWLKHSILPGTQGYPQQRFGDVQFYDGFMGIVWQTLATFSGDDELREITRRIRPEPRHILELLFWDPLPAPPTPPATPAPSLQVYATSGMAFIRDGGLRLTVRAGEFWGHNHLDAGSFVFCQDDLVWIDDSGACDYGRPEYPDYYVSAAAHNIAYAPDLAPPSRRAHYTGLPETARYLLSAQAGPLKVLCADTGILSGGALARSHRWFLALGDEAAVLWDDLAAYREQRFAFLLHTTATLDETAPALNHGTARCPLHFFSSTPARRHTAPAPMGQLSGRGEQPVRDLEGRLLSWETAPVERAKFGLALGTALRSADWTRCADDGAHCDLRTAKVRWQLWFNPRADGRVMHENRTSCWGEYETDAHLLALREEAGASRIYAVDASFLRTPARVLFASLSRQPISDAALT